MSIGQCMQEFRFAVAADHAAARQVRERYPTDGPSMQPKGVVAAAVFQIGFQMLIAVRLMRLLGQLGIPGGGPVVSRAIRHVYGAEIHWKAEISPGISIVHGNGLVVSHGAKIGPGCVLFQNVTLGESMRSAESGTRTVGSPTLDADVHVMPGAILLGPISVGKGSKIGANAVVDADVPAGSVVRSPVSSTEQRLTKPVDQEKAMGS